MQAPGLCNNNSQAYRAVAMLVLQIEMLVMLQMFAYEPGRAWRACNHTLHAS